MGEHVTIATTDGFQLGAYVAQPAGDVKGAIVVLQEVFGVNQHIREVADGYAESGYYAIAPKIFDRIERDIELGYEEADMGRALSLAFEELDLPLAQQDIQVAINAASEQGKVGMVGYCFGGLLTWLSACGLEGLSAASAYYGGGVAGHMEKSPRCPVIMHFGALDAHIPMSDVEAVKAAQPATPVYVYDADHGFNCDHRASFDAASSELALERTLAHFQKHL